MADFLDQSQIDKHVETQRIAKALETTKDKLRTMWKEATPSSFNNRLKTLDDIGRYISDLGKHIKSNYRYIDSFNKLKKTYLQRTKG